MQKIIVYYWKNKKIPKVPSSALTCRPLFYSDLRDTLNSQAILLLGEKLDGVHIGA